MELAVQGFVTAIANPKGWAFMISLLPPFINPEHALTPQMMILLTIILTIEFFCLIVYASGGKTLRNILQKKGNIKIMNRIAGTLMLGVGVWMALG
jgi:homoserine/homoserine lactone efflux protein